jgi:heme/copper-type cytochrome/quinol oxidase subunit 2
MANPIIHVLVLIAAIVLPGGLLIYFAWRANKARRRSSQKPATTPEEAREAFLAAFPLESLRIKNRRMRLGLARKYRRKKSE